MRDILWCTVTKRVIDSPTVRVRGDDSDSDDDKEENFFVPLIGENPEHYVDAGYDFETLNGLVTYRQSFNWKSSSTRALFPFTLADLVLRWLT